MTSFTSTLQAFVKLGSYIRDFCEKYTLSEGDAYQDFRDTVVLAEQQNGWFTQENILYALNQWSQLLTEEHLNHWISKYAVDASRPERTVAIIMAGNIPLVGFHDFLCVLLTGNKVLVKLSSNDKVLLPFLSKFLMVQDPTLRNKIIFVEGKLDYFDAVIATGSNNTSRYFEYYFGKKPNIIRKNRSSVAVLSGNETKEELASLGEDIFRYYGLGCRSVSKLYVPKDYDFDLFFDAIFAYKDMINQTKYANNYDYNKAVYLMSEFKILDNGFLILKEDGNLASPIASLFYSYYNSPTAVLKELEKQKDNLQCVVASEQFGGTVGFGKTQAPKLDNYADGVDTIAFLTAL